MLEEDVRKLLTALGIAPSEDDPLLAFVCRSVAERVKNETNRDAVPDGLRYMAAEMAAGQYLSWKKDAGELAGFDTEAAIKEIKEGDTDVTYAIGEGSQTPEQRLDSLIDYLINGRTREFIRYRRLLW